jgi:hypothetical protein
MCGLGLCFFPLSHNAASALQQSYATQRVKPCRRGSKTEHLWTERSRKILWNLLETERTYMNKFSTHTHALFHKIAVLPLIPEFDPIALTLALDPARLRREQRTWPAILFGWSGSEFCLRSSE